VLRLGSGGAIDAGTGTKAGLLDRCAAAGVRVPEGWIVLDEARHATDVGDDAALAALAGRWPPGTQLAVRSAFAAEDSAEKSLAGHFQSVLHVPADDPAAVASALRQVWASGEGNEADPDGTMRRDVLVMSMVDAVHAGVAALQVAFEDDLVEYVEGTAEALVAGRADDVRRQMLPRLRGWERAARGPDRVPLPFWGMRLSAMFGELRQVVGEGDWDVEWADDGEHAWLLQVRPLTAPVRRRETLTVSNFREILPEVPSPFMTSLIAERAPALFEFYRQFDRRLPANRPFATVVEGRPYLNLSLLEDMLRGYGLPTGMLANAVGGESVTRAPIRPIRVLRHSPTLARMALTQLLAPSRVGEVSQRLQELADSAEAADQTAPVVDAAAEAYTLLMTGMVSMATFIGPGMALLRGAGTLAAHGAGHRTETTRMWEDLEEVRRGRESMQSWLAQHGHRGVYETDFAQPRFAENPELLDHVIATDAVTATDVVSPGGPPAGAPSALTRARTAVTWPLWQVTARAVRARESLRSEAMRSFLRIRAVLVARAEQLVAEGVLDSAEDIWLLTTDEVRALDTDWRPEPALLRHRAELWEAYAADTLPDFMPGDHQVVTPPGTEARRLQEQTAPEGGLLRGLGITEGQAHGRAWVLRSPAFRLPEGFTPEDTVLVARTVDAGWLPTFALVSAVVVEVGGDLSHGSILLREVGIPTVTNCRGILAAVETGDELTVRAHRGQVVLGRHHEVREPEVG
jgi:pyruvate,water dikinase